MVGAGTMGAGIAQLACLVGRADAASRPGSRGARARARVDPTSSSIEASSAGVWRRAGSRGRRERLAPAPALEDLAPCGAGDRGRAGIARAQARRCSPARGRDRRRPTACWRRTRPRCWSRRSPPAAAHPERVVGMHFFNPAPVMRLLEVVAGDQSGAGCARARPRRRRGDGQARDRRRRRARFPGQPLQPPVRARGAAAAAGGGRAGRADRPDLPPRRRLPDGPVRAHGPRRRRCRARRLSLVLRAELRRAALATLADHRAIRSRRAALGASRAVATTTTARTAAHRPAGSRAAGRRAAATG